MIMYMNCWKCGKMAKVVFDMATGKLVIKTKCNKHELAPVLKTGTA